MAPLVADLTSDGIADLGFRSGQDFIVLANDGAGNFSAPRSTRLSPIEGAHSVADLDGDGALDLITTAHNGQTSTVLLNDGSGQFPYPGQRLTTESTGNLWVADVNRDRLLDLIIPAFPVRVALAQSDGSHRVVRSINVPGFTIDQALSDLNNDGVPDLVFRGTFTDSFVFSSLGNGDGTFRQPVRLDILIRPERLVVADFNKDRIPDIVASNFNSMEIALAIGNGDGTFQVSRRFPSGSPGRTFAAGDVNGDGAADVVTIGTVLLSDGNGGFLPPKSFDVPPRNLERLILNQPHLADITGDGALDVIFKIDRYQLVVFPGTGRGDFQLPLTLIDRLEPWVTELADMDGDGHLDLVVADADTVGFVAGDGRGNFAPMHRYLLSRGSADLPIPSVVDLNGDGALDFVFGSVTGVYALLQQ
jgi:hypothetical protein